MVQITSSLNLILLANSLLAIVFILNQNESSKELTANSNSNSASNPLENFTWGCLERKEVTDSFLEISCLCFN